MLTLATKSVLLSAVSVVLIGCNCRQVEHTGVIVAIRPAAFLTAPGTYVKMEDSTVITLTEIRGAVGDTIRWKEKECDTLISVGGE